MATAGSYNHRRCPVVPRIHRGPPTQPFWSSNQLNSRPVCVGRPGFPCAPALLLDAGMPRACTPLEGVGGDAVRFTVSWPRGEDGRWPRGVAHQWRELWSSRPCLHPTRDASVRQVRRAASTSPHTPSSPSSSQQRRHLHQHAPRRRRAARPHHLQRPPLRASLTTFRVGWSPSRQPTPPLSRSRGPNMTRDRTAAPRSVASLCRPTAAETVFY